MTDDSKNLLARRARLPVRPHGLRRLNAPTKRKLGWRNRVGDFLRYLEATVFDPWFKPAVRGLRGIRPGRPQHHRRASRAGPSSPARRATRPASKCAEQFWETLHIDLRMVDTSDFTVAYVPTNIYSVGTAHEVILTRLQLKPVLFVRNPAVEFPDARPVPGTICASRETRRAARMLDLRLATTRLPIKPNPRGIPSLMVHAAHRRDVFRWLRVRGVHREISAGTRSPWTRRKNATRPQNPAACRTWSTLARRRCPSVGTTSLSEYVTNDDWLLWDLENIGDGGRPRQGT